MNPRLKAIFKLLVFLTVFVLLFAVFPGALWFVEMAARNLRYFWWLILLVLLAIWLIWVVGKKPNP